MKRVEIGLITLLLAPGLILTCFLASCALKNLKREMALKKVSTPLVYQGYSFPEYKSYVKKSEYVEMSDGVKIAMDIFIPSEGPPKTSFPVVFMFTPYSRSFVFPSVAKPWQRAFSRIAMGTRGPVIDSADQNKMVKLLLSHGYVFAIADMRGTGASYGWKFEAMPKYSEDGGELVNWLAHQPWSDGNVGMCGRSYLGYSQLATAGSKPKALKCIFPEVTFFDGFSELVYPGGIYLNLVAKKYIERLERLNLNYFVFTPSSLLETIKEGIPAISLPCTPVVDEDRDGELQDEIPLDLNDNGTFLDDYHFPEDRSDPPQYQDNNPREHIYYLATKDHQKNIDAIELSSKIFFIDATYPKIPFPLNTLNSYDLSSSTYLPAIMETGIPVYNSGEWHDLYVRSHTMFYSTMKRTNPSKMIIGAGFHRGKGPYWKNFGEDQDEYITGLALERLRFFDRYLRGIDNGIDKEPPIYIYVQNGKGWRFEHEWPLARQVEKRLYFQPGAKLGENQKEPGADKYQCDFTHDNRFGKASGNRYFAGMGITPEVLPVRTEKDQQCLIYTSLPMEADTEVTGHPIIHLWVSSTADNGDFYVYLEDVEPNGRVILVTEGMLRAGFAKLHDNDKIIQSGVRKIDVLPDLPWHGFEQSHYIEGILANGNVVELKLDLLPTSWVFRKNHRIRVSIACANWPTFRLHPRLAPNNRPDDPANTVPTVTIYRDKERASFINLPVIPD